ncbi:MAG TPA: hypothetical protein PKD45_07245 [Flavobacteriales bacterium]|nr:hypothetical protein [Flavobacteriales bacterium]
MAVDLDDAIKAHLVVDWTRKEDVKHRMEQALEDRLYALRNDGLELGFDAIDQLLEGALRVAERHYG